MIKKCYLRRHLSIISATIISISCLFRMAAGYGIVNNSTISVSPEDSICIPFLNLDSLGRNIGGLDTSKIIVFNPGGDSTFCEIIVGVSGRVKMSVDNGDTSYRWAAQVSDIDGDGQYGQYIVKVTAKSDQTGGWLKTTVLREFQLVGRELDDALVATVDSLKKTLDSIYAANFRLKTILDSLQSQDNWVMAKTDSALIDISSNIAYADTVANRVLEDSIHYQGAGAGYGIYTYCLYAVDSSLGQAIPGVNLEIRNIAQTALIALNVSNAQGYGIFKLPADSFVVNAFAPPYLFPNYDTIVVSGPGTDSIFGVHFDPGSPASPELCRVYGFLYDITGQPEESATVAVWLPAGAVRVGGGVISPFKTVAFTDSMGYFYLDLIPNSVMTPDTARYEFTIMRSDGAIIRERVAIPAVPSWQLNW
jgi:hypothetical protein